MRGRCHGGRHGRANSPGALRPRHIAGATLVALAAFTLGGDLLRATGATAVVVTFLGELATFDPGTVSLACVLEPGEADEPPRPTFRLERGPADPLAQARAVARAHALDRASVHERISR